MYLVVFDVVKLNEYAIEFQKIDPLPDPSLRAEFNAGEKVNESD